jgi:hypothetical protein
MLITEPYRQLNAQLHKEREDYGIGGHRYARQVQDLARQTGANTILDYGCGKRTLERALGFQIDNYDPAIPGCEAAPNAADLVVCTDVLEHIEPACLDAVLDDLKRVTREIIVLTVATRPAKKTLADGTNAHKIIESSRWWLPKIMARFELMNFAGNEAEFFAILKSVRVMQ